jgi:hypothetical protein
MACFISIRSVDSVKSMPTSAFASGIVITGVVIDCPAGIGVTVANAAGQSVIGSPTISFDGSGNYRIDAPYTQQVACDEQLDVNVFCTSSPTSCRATWPVPGRPPEVSCCSCTIDKAGAVSRFGLSPTHLLVAGRLRGVPRNERVTIEAVVIRGMPTAPVRIPMVASTLATVNDYSGAFSAEIPLLPLNPALACNEEVEVRVFRTSDPSCDDTTPRGFELDCSQCFRGTINIVRRPCVGTAPNQQQPIDFEVAISVPAGAMHTFTIDFGNGNTASIPVNNTNGDANVVHTWSTTQTSQTQLYGTGDFTVVLSLPGVGECDPVIVTFTVSCDDCPDAKATVSVGKCVTSGPLTNTRPVTYTLEFDPPLDPNCTAFVTLDFGTDDLATGLSEARLSRTGPGQLTHTAFLPAGRWQSKAYITIVCPGNVALCVPPPPTVRFTTLPPPPSGTPPPPPRVVVPACLPCPVVTARVTTRALPAPHVELEAVIAWPTSVTSPPSPTKVSWSVTHAGKTATVAKFNPAVTKVTTQDGEGWEGLGATTAFGVALSTSGRYEVSVDVEFAGAGLPDDCVLNGATSFDVLGTPTVCPTVMMLEVDGTPGCADPTQGMSATVDFKATIVNPGGGPYQWDFGDTGSPSNSATTTTPEAQHTYSAPGSYLVTVEIVPSTDCPATSATRGQLSFTIATCPCPGGAPRQADGTCPQTGGGEGEGTPCRALRWLAVGFLAAAIILGLILTCVWSALPQWAAILIIVVSALFLTAGLVLFFIWLFVCNVKPCLWGWLLAAQVHLAVGLFCIYMTSKACSCWPWMLGIGIGALVLAAVFTGIWIYRCCPDACQVLIELTPVVSDVIAFIGLVLLVPIFAACVNKWVISIVGILMAVAVAAIAECALRPGGVQTKTGGPCRNF